MVSDEKIQADLITKLRSITSVTDLLSGGASTGQNEVRELQWQGDEFGYPNIRLDLESNEYVFDEQARCQVYVVEFSIYIFAEDASSKKCSQIKGLLENYLTGLGWTGTYARYVRLRLQDNIPAVREDERVWRSQLKYLTRILTL